MVFSKEYFEEQKKVLQSILDDTGQVAGSLRLRQVLSRKHASLLKKVDADIQVCSRLLSWLSNLNYSNGDELSEVDERLANIVRMKTANYLDVQGCVLIVMEEDETNEAI